MENSFRLTSAVANCYRRSDLLVVLEVPQSPLGRMTLKVSDFERAITSDIVSWRHQT